MKRQCILVMLLVIFSFFMFGCHTVQTLGRIDTGRIGFSDVWDSMVMDDFEFQENYW